MEDRDLVLMALMVPAMGTVEAMDTVTDLVPAMDTVTAAMEEAAAATLGAVEVAGPKDPEPVPPVADLWSLPASATVRAKTPKWRIG
jgi:hypothetical protein